MTLIQLITDALLEIAVINESETPTAEQAAGALRRLNQLMEEWDEAGIRLGWCEQTDTTATAPLPPYAERGVTLKLALALAPSYGGAASVTPLLAQDAEEAYLRILRKHMLKNLTPSDTSNMPRSEVPGGTFNILTG